MLAGGLRFSAWDRREGAFMHKPLFAASLAAALSLGAASAQVSSGAITPVRPDLRIRAACGGSVDLAITSATLFKLARPGSARVEFDIYNLGPGEWNSGAQQVANLVVHNGASGHDYTMTSVPIGGRRFAAGERVGHVVSPPVNSAFDPLEFAGTVQMTLSFDPDILLDSNPCNDDSNPANNTFAIDSAGVQSFLTDGAPAHTFQRP